MFSHAPALTELSILDTSPVPAAWTIHLDLTSQFGSAGMMFVVTVTNRTVGTVSASFLGAATAGGATLPLGSDLTRSIAADAMVIIPLTGTIPPFVDLVLTPAGGFDGSVAVTLRSSEYTGNVGVSS